MWLLSLIISLSLSETLIELYRTVRPDRNRQRRLSTSLTLHYGEGGS